MEFTARFAAEGITANAVHPGGIMTGLQKQLTKQEMQARGWIDKEGKVHEAFKTISQGAATTLWVATTATLDGIGGRYCEVRFEIFFLVEDLTFV